MRYQFLLVLVMVCGFASTAFGIGGRLTRPMMGYPADLDFEAQQKAQTALQYMQDELTFVDGSWVNQFFRHRFGGTAAQTARFLALLEDGPWTVRVAFRDFGEQQAAFTVNQVMGNNTLWVTVNSAREDFRLSDFQSYLPRPSWQPSSEKAPPDR